MMAAWRLRTRRHIRSRGTWSRMGLAVLALAASGCATAGTAQDTAASHPTTTTAQSAPRIHVIATGGTISNTEGEGRWTGEEIVAAVPGIDEVARFTVEQFSNIASGSFTPAMWLDLARRVETVFAEDPDLAGVIITHGTDTMEETAYFLDLTIGDDRPVIITGAMRNNSRLSSDGAANFYNAARLATHPDARGRGTMVVMNDVALPAREATKMNTSRVEAFDAPGRGPLAILDPDTIVFMEAVAPRPPAVVDVSALDELPRVDVIFSYVGADGALVDAAVAAGARGIVMAGVGRGGTTPGQREAMDRAVEAGVFVVASNRTMSGRVPVGSAERRLDDWKPGRGIRFGAAALTPQKARVLLMLALAATDDPEEILELFRTR